MNTKRTDTRRPPFLARLAGQAVARLYLRRPELAEVIAIRYRSVRGLLLGIGNEIAYRLGLSRAPGLISANLELTNHCNLKCSFCPTGNGLLARPRGFMEPDVFRRALRGAGPLEFTLLFQWGESLLHPHFTQLAREARAHGARTLVTTNGTLIDERRVNALLDAGLDRITVSVDGDATTHERVRGVPLARTEAGLDRLIAERDRRGLDTAVDVSMVVAPETEAAAEAFGDRYRDRVERVQKIPLLTCGERRTRCREPWRGGLVVLQDGRVTVCCVDHDGELAFGDVRKQRLRDLWNAPALRELRRRHVRGDLPPVCARCTEYPTDAAAPRFSRRSESSSEAPHLQLPDAGRRPRRPRPAASAEEGAA
ncbi:MAG: radical SAM protein [Planctomycetota bacterium]|nr:radical SAM protein [Planctomycetota bacterium]